ncbi:MAG TPA: hypothetical protein VN647_08875 [Nitrospira sp.]|nr:hypothetical protein [Nitrospira sp.]
MNKNAKAWVRALRSGKYQQGKGRLRKGDSYCCLGVACELAKRKRVIKRFVGNRSNLPQKVKKWLGLRSEEGAYDFGYLTTDNDIWDKTFAQIADIIDSEPEGLFVEE